MFYSICKHLRILQDKHSQAFLFSSLVSVLEKYLEIQSGLSFIAQAGQWRHPQTNEMLIANKALALGVVPLLCWYCPVLCQGLLSCLVT